MTVVSAASFTVSLADGSRASVFGRGLATGVLVASITQPNGFPAINPAALPTMLLGTKVEITDSAGATRLAPLFFVSPFQVDIQIPEGTASGRAQIVLTSGDRQVSRGEFTVAPIAPSLFAANNNGQGPAFGFIVRQKRAGGSDLTQPLIDLDLTEQDRGQDRGQDSRALQTSIEPLSVFDRALGRFVANPIELRQGEEVLLVLLGSGFRNASSSTHNNIIVGGRTLRATFVGPQDAAGLDRIQAPLRRSRDGSGEVDVLVDIDGKKSNTVKISFK